MNDAIARRRRLFAFGVELRGIAVASLAGNKSKVWDTVIAISYYHYSNVTLEVAKVLFADVFK